MLLPSDNSDAVMMGRTEFFDPLIFTLPDRGGLWLTTNLVNVYPPSKPENIYIPTNHIIFIARILSPGQNSL